MDPRRLELLLDLSRLGSMRAVAETRHTTTSTVSQQLALLAREAGVALLEPEGRRVRLTPAGRRLADHAVTILAALEAARSDLDPDATPAGVVRVASFASAIRDTLVPLVRRLAADHPAVTLEIHEHEPPESAALLAADGVDLALSYDYDLAPAGFDAGLEARPLGVQEWGLVVPAGAAGGGVVVVDESPASTLEAFRAFADHDWIVNSRNTADRDAVTTVGSMAGVTPRIVHECDSLDLVADLVAAGLGVGLIGPGFDGRPGVRVLPLRDPAITLRRYTVARRGRTSWPPLALVLDLITGSVDSSVSGSS